MTTRLFFGGLIAIVLLGLYVYATVYSVQAALCLGPPNSTCTAYKPELTDGVVTVLNLVGGLVAALVISVLAISEPKGAPGSGLVETTATPLLKNSVTIVSTGYIVVWVACGVAALVVGLMKYPDAVPLLNAAAKSWLGLAVAAAYAYLNLKPATA
jgi:hypothetical protein